MSQQTRPPTPGPVIGAFFQAQTLTSLAWLFGLAAAAAFAFGLTSEQEGNEVLPGLLALAGCAVFLVGFVSCLPYAAGERRWLVSLGLLALLVRAALALAIYYGPIDRDIFGEDQPGYDHMPRLVANYWAGTGPRPDRLLEQTNRLGYYFFVAVQYSILGPSLLIPRMFNCLAGSLLAVYTYRLGEAVFGRTEGKVAAVWVSLFPSLVLWSSLNLRDIWLALAILIIVFHAVLLRERFSPASLSVILLWLLWIDYNRFYLFLVMVLAVVGIVVVWRPGAMGRTLVLLAVVLGLIFAFNLYFGVGEQSREWADLERIASYRKTLADARVGGSGYLGDVDLTDPVVLALFIPLGLAYFLFSPFPWEITGLRQALTVPEMVLWYLAFPFLARSIFRLRWTTIPRAAGLLLAMGLISFGYAIGTANMGAAYRYRAQVVAFYLLFAAAGYLRSRQVPSPGRGGTGAVVATERGIRS